MEHNRQIETEYKTITTIKYKYTIYNKIPKNQSKQRQSTNYTFDYVTQTRKSGPSWSLHQRCIEEATCGPEIATMKIFLWTVWNLWRSIKFSPYFSGFWDFAPDLTGGSVPVWTVLARNPVFTPSETISWLRPCSRASLYRPLGAVNTVINATERNCHNIGNSVQANFTIGLIRLNCGQ